MGWALMDEAFSTRLKQLRGSLSREQMGLFLGCTEQWIGKLENGTGKPSAKVAKQVDETLSLQNPSAHIARILSTKNIQTSAPARQPSNVARPWAAEILRTILDAIARKLRSATAASKRGSRKTAEPKRPQRSSVEYAILEFLGKAIEAPGNGNRLILMLFLSRAFFQSEETRSGFIGRVLQAARKGKRLLYATVEALEPPEFPFRESHLALSLEAAIAATYAEGEYRPEDRNLAFHRHQRPETFACRSFGTLEAGLDRQSLPQTAVAINLVVSPNRTLFMSLPSPSIDESTTHLVIPLRGADDKNALESFEACLEHHEPHIVVYPPYCDEEFWERYAQIESLLYEERKLAQRFFSTVTRPTGYFHRRGRWYKRILKMVGGDKELADKIAHHRHVRAETIKARLTAGTPYRQICDLETIKRWLENGERPDVATLPGEDSYRDNQVSIVERLKEIEELLENTKYKFELAFAEQYDTILYPGAPHALLHGWIVVDREYTIIEVCEDRTIHTPELRVLLKTAAVAQAFSAWFDEAWEQVPEKFRDRRENLQRVRDWIKEAESRL